MNYRLGFFILALIVGGLISYLIFRDREAPSIPNELKKDKEVLIDSKESEIEALNNRNKLIQDEKITTINVYDTISKRELVKRADSIYRYGMRRDK